MAQRDAHPVRRLFRTLVVSSALALGAAGCELSHELPPDLPPPPPPPDPDDGGGPRLADAGTHPVDAGRGHASDAGETDAGALDAAPPVDAGETDPRACEQGWPTTKGFFCTTFDEDRLLCCNSFVVDGGPPQCCLREAS